MEQRYLNAWQRFPMRISIIYLVSYVIYHIAAHPRHAMIQPPPVAAFPARISTRKEYNAIALILSSDVKSP